MDCTRNFLDYVRDQYSPRAASLGDCDVVNIDITGAVWKRLQSDLESAVATADRSAELEQRQAKIWGDGYSSGWDDRDVHAYSDEAATKNPYCKDGES